MIDKRLLVLVLLFHVAGCGDDSSAGIAISGGHSVSMGQSLSLSAATTGGSYTFYTWQVADPRIASVSGTGMVIGNLPGETTVTVRGAHTKATGSHGVVVVQALVVLAGVTLVDIGGTSTLAATTVNGTDASYTWASGDESIATVDPTGTVTGVAEGQVTLTATGDTSGASGSVSIIVTGAARGGGDGLVASGARERRAPGARGRRAARVQCLPRHRHRRLRAAAGYLPHVPCGGGDAAA